MVDVTDGNGKVGYLDLENYDHDQLKLKFQIVREGSVIKLLDLDGNFIARYKLSGDTYVEIKDT